MGSLSQEELWARSDQYHNSFLIPADEALEYARKNSNANGLPEIAVSTAQGKFLNLLARSIGAKRILEVGTLGGFSTIWLARALPADGELLTCELSEKHAEVARANIAHAGLANKVQIARGPAADTLKKLRPAQPYDFVFIDADKPNNLTYFIEAKRLVKKGGVIIVDNVARKGLVPDETLNDANLEGVRKLLRYLKDDKEVDATTISTVGEKGYDGFLYAVRL
ncbi:O-methyltransferase family 3 protein [Obba rivulosa]|uniref:O-methyltransferase family 3 protein n=1 Tax=Obba rivulosa TaxID=1052685 RepID=A0A8E2J6A9_9APHY|nr:O-methyltransferase family 3 protein [Obba rivulosa]